MAQEPLLPFAGREELLPGSQGQRLPHPLADQSLALGQAAQRLTHGGSHGGQHGQVLRRIGEFLQEAPAHLLRLAVQPHTRVEQPDGPNDGTDVRLAHDEEAVGQPQDAQHQPQGPEVAALPAQPGAGEMGPVEVGLGLQEPGRGSEALHQTGDGQQDSPVEGQVLLLLGFG